MKKLSFHLIHYSLIFTLLFHPMIGYSADSPTNYYKMPGSGPSCSATCAKDAKELGPQMGALCTDWKNTKSGIEPAKNQVIANSVAAGVCIAACITQNLAITASLGLGTPAAKAAADAACGAAGLAQIAVEIADTVKLMKEGQGFMQSISHNMMGAMAGTAGSAVALYGAGQAAMGKHSKDAAKLAAEEAAEKVGKKVAEKGSKQFAKSFTMGACLAPILFTAGATISGITMKSLRSKRDDLCEQIEKYKSQGTVVHSSIDPPSRLSASNPTGLGGGAGSRANGAAPGFGGEVAGSNPEDTAETEIQDTQAFLQGIHSSASESPLSKLFNQMGDASKIDEVLKALGTDIKDMAKRLNTESPASVLNSLAPNIPEPLSSGITTVESGLKDGTVTAEGLIPGGSYGGGKAAAATADSTKKGPISWDFGGLKKKDGAGGPASKELSFSNQTKLQLDPASDDPFHSDFKGTVFQIISLRMEKTRDRIELMEWSLPLNRALAGLPNTPSAPIPTHTQPVKPLTPLILGDK